MNYGQFRKHIDPLLEELPKREATRLLEELPKREATRLLEELPKREATRLLEEEHEGVAGNIENYVNRRCEIIEGIISFLPSKTTQTLRNIGEGANLIADALIRRRELTDLHYTSHEHALLYGAPRTVLRASLTTILEKYQYLARVAYGMAKSREGTSGNLLPLVREKWLEV